MTDVPSRAPTGVRTAGDDYQHLVTWNEVMLALRPTSTARTISVEAPKTYNLDDVVVEYDGEPTKYIQVKHAVDATTPVGTAWLMEPAGKRTLLQKFYDSWSNMANGEQLYMQLVTDRDADSGDGLMKGLDQHTELLMPVAMGRQRAVTAVRKAWAQHLGIDEEELGRFLTDLRFRTGRTYAAEVERAQSLMYGNGLNTDRNTIDLGIALVRHWVQLRDRKLDIGTLRTMAEERVGTQQEEAGAVLIIDGILHDLHPEDAHERVDFVSRYQQDDPNLRRDLNDDGEWTQVGAEIAEACGRLKAAGHHRVVIRGAMRLPMWFAAGANLRHTEGMSIATIQRGAIWSSSDAEKSRGLCTTTPHRLGLGNDLAVAVGISDDPTNAVLKYVAENGLPAQTVAVVEPARGPGPETIAGSASAASMAVAVRTAIRDLLENAPETEQIHLFLVTPGGFAALLGHRWNALRPTIVYEHRGMGRGYTPTFLFNA